MKRGVGSVLLIVLAAMTACSTGPDLRGDDRDSGPDEILGAPPEPGSEDYEFAPPPEHPASPSAQSTPAPAEEWDGESTVMQRRYLDRLRDYGPSVVLQHIETQPYHEGDEFVGFELVELSPQASHYVEPRLQVGDVITHINLVRLEQPDDYMEAWQTLEEAGEIRIDLVRNGEADNVVWVVE